MQTIILAAFLCTAYLNLRDLKVLKQQKWSSHDSVALFIRHGFYAFFFSFFVLILIRIVAWILSAVLNAYTTFRFPAVFTIWAILPSLILFIVSGVIYGLARWRDMYDIVDSE